MKTLLTLAAFAAGGWILLMFGLKGIASLLRRSTVRYVRRALEGRPLIRLADNASYLGADFSGPNLPPRTTGVLALTPDRLFFLPWFPRRAITLPRDTIAAVATRDTFRGMAYNIPALTVRVRGVGDPDGEMAWLVAEPEAWRRDIRSLAG